MTSGPAIRRTAWAGWMVAASASLMLAASLWWWVVFRPVVLAGYLSVTRALPCLVSGSIRCTLAEALCNGQHVLGIRRYDQTMIWLAFGLAAASIVLVSQGTISGRRRPAPGGTSAGGR